MSDNVNNQLLLFFDRPCEPCFMRKGKDNSVLEIPDHYYPEKYKSLSSTLSNRFGGDGPTLPVRNISLPDLSLPMQLPYNSQFSVFVPKHRQMAAKLIDIFMGMRDVPDLVSVCSYCQLRINPYMFNYCLTVAILHRPDTKGINIPTIVESFPDKFMDAKVFRKAREVSTTVPTGPRMPILIPKNFTAADSEPEQRMAYFREDIGIDLHHHHWHTVYPFDAADRAIVNKDRRGELFYYMHQQIIARYNFGRLCNDLPRVLGFCNYREPITEAYFPKLDSQVASRTWSSRCAGTPIRDMNRPVDLIKADVAELETWRDRVITAIENGFIILSDNRQMPLDEETGMDVLGNLIEASVLSLNHNYYGSLHNLGHLFLAFVHDPDHRHLEQFGVMGDQAVSPRDPVFYRWHSCLDDLFVMHKKKLTPYSTDLLDFPGIRVTSINVEGSAGNNTFATQWEQSTVELGRGLDFTPRGSVLARFTHLQHDEYTYVIDVDNTSGKSATGTFRIFLAPTADEWGKPFSFEDHRRIMIEMDKFSHTLNAGNNTIRRRSQDSSVTIPYERTFRNLEDRPEPGTPETAQFDFCGCGWPQHMLVPKGTKLGFPVVLYCMVSNWNDDKIEQDTVGTCNDAASYCGIRDRRYPDRRAMGYPFDRPARGGVSALADFLTPNMAVRDCTIRFTDATRPRGQQG